MATMKEMLRLEAETKQAERDALRALAAHLREAVIGLPPHSSVARSFAKRSQDFDLWATGRDAFGLWGDITLRGMLCDLADEDYRDDEATS